MATSREAPQQVVEGVDVRRGARWRRRRVGLADEAGLTIIEMVVAFSLLAIVILSLTSSVAVGFNLVRMSKVNQTATQLANSEIERIRRIRDVTGETAELTNRGGYQDIGTCRMQGGGCVPSGFPPGVIPESREKTVRDLTYVINVSVELRSDPVQGEASTYDDYKLVTVAVQPKNPALGKRITAKTIIAPETSANPGTVRVTVVDAGGSGTQPVQGVEVRAVQGAQSAGSLFSNASGIALFAGLQVSTPYTFQVIDTAGWKVVPSTVSNCPASESRTLNPLQEEHITLCVFRPITLSADVRAAGTQAPISDHMLALVVEGNGKFASAQKLYDAATSPIELDADGRTWTFTQFDPQTPVAAGLRYYAAVWATGRARQWVELTPTDNTAVDLELEAATTGGATFEVRSGGTPVGGAWITVRQGLTEIVKYAVTRVDGTVRVDLRPGTYTVEAVTPTGVDTRVVTVTAGGEASVVFTVT